MKASAGRFKALLIDWDGTLIDSLPLKIDNAAALFEERLGARPGEVAASYARHSGVPRRTLFDRISFDCIGRSLNDEEYQSLSDAFTERNIGRVAAEGSLRSDAMDTLSLLIDRGVLLFISTSAAQGEIDTLARHFGLDRVCTGIFGSRPAFSKGREHARRVMEGYEIGQEEMAGIGDDIQDMILFNEAGIFAIGITGTRSRTELRDAGASMVIDKFREVAACAG